MTQWQPSLILEGKDRNVSVLKDKCFEEILYVPKHLKQPWTSEHGFRITLVFAANDILKD